MTSLVLIRVKDKNTRASGDVDSVLEIEKYKHLEHLMTSLVLIGVKDQNTRASGDVDSVLQSKG